MAISITSRTKAAAPDRSVSRSRTTIGVGEEVVFEANMPVNWTINGEVFPGGQQTRITELFLEKGAYVVRAERAGSHSVELLMTVIEPQLHYERDPFQPTLANLFEVPGGVIPPGIVGIGLYVKVTMTPPTVSFANLQFRELSGFASGVWGYYATHRANPSILGAMTHNARSLWQRVDSHNVALNDRIGILIDPAMYPTPFNVWMVSVACARSV